MNSFGHLGWFSPPLLPEINPVLTWCGQPAGWGDSSFGYRMGLLTLGTRVGIPVTAIVFSCATIHFLDVYNLQRHQRPASSSHTIPIWHGRLKIS